MKKLLIIAVSIILTIGTISCSKMAMMVYGVKNPKPETHSSVIGFLRNIGVNDTILYNCADSASFVILFNSNPGVPDIEIYNKEGYLVPYKDPDNSNPNCNASAGSFISNLKDKQQRPYTNQSIEERLKLLVNSSTLTGITLNDIPPSDYYILIYFTKWTGKKVNRDHVPYWIKEIETTNNPSCRISYLLVDLDFMEYWNMNTQGIKFENNKRKKAE